MQENQLINVFYCWQSDLPNDENRNYLKHILEDIKNKLKINHIKITIDEATRDMIGSLNISQAILNKIQNADIFICDVSIINSNSIERKVPNPNVMYELGFAVASLGWERIILVFNENYGKIHDLPFDLEKYRTTIYRPIQYRCDDNLINNLKDKIKNIIDYSPTKGFLSPQAEKLKIQYKKDIENIKKFFGSFLIRYVDEFYNEAPRRLNINIHIFFENFEKLLFNNANNFFLYDKELHRLINNFYQYWKNSLPLNFQEIGYYHEAGNDYAIFSNPMDAPLSAEQDKTWQRIHKNTYLMKLELNKILEYVHKKYIEVDVEHIQKELYREWKNL